MKSVDEIYCMMRRVRTAKAYVGWRGDFVNVTDRDEILARQKQQLKPHWPFVSYFRRPTNQLRNRLYLFKHSKPNDFIYVSGHLSSYTKNDPNGSCSLYHELVVKELNYVTRQGQGPRPENLEKPQSNGGETGLEKHRERLHLWQVFFANPYDWWDNRKKKLNPRQPDFKHKHMDEALWLSPNDPPWVKTQIDWLDARMAEQGHGEQGGHHRISKWEYDE
ncbi:protein OSB1, mitochondrial [Argentina anserina]|uniref:protein OSB1, mitochondrial n=1 Tax=Argentina anserina TaxID=57926 RepID=UPI0021762D68|nr:protein OSB1, mitochondrial [Potentilla anserina]